MALQHIPPIQCLLTFEAVARLRHAGRAADELCVTPSAVSHRIRQLESHVGFKLFGRGDFSLAPGEAATAGDSTLLLNNEEVTASRRLSFADDIKIRTRRPGPDAPPTEYRLQFGRAIEDDGGV